MIPVGFDLSTDKCRVAFITAGNIAYRDVKNREGHKETQAAICFEGKQRFIGKSATSRVNCFSHIMRMIGKTMSDLKSESELSPLVENGPGGLLVVRVSDGKDELHFAPTQLLAMMISDLKAAVEKELQVDDIRECCIAIPGHFSESQRTAVRQAAEIAGLDTVSLLESTTAIALGHAIIKRKVHMHDAVCNVVVVDIGVATMQVSIVCLKKESLDVLSFAHDPCTGERSLVDNLVNYFKKTSVCNDDASLRKDCEVLKQQSTKFGGKTELTYGGKQISKSMFEVVCEPIWSSMKVLLEEALTQAALGQEKINGILVCGSGSECYGIKEQLENFFPRQQKGAEKHVIVAVDSVAKGCAIQCALTSKAFKGREDHPRNDKMKKNLVEFKVSNKWPPVKDKTTKLQVAEATDGRLELTPSEVNAARECERKMVLREKIRVKICDMLQVMDFAKKEETEKLNEVRGQLEKDDDLDEGYDHMTLVANKIMARKYERHHRGSVIKNMKKQIKEYEGFLSSEEPKYRTIKKEAKDKFKNDCEDAKEWLREKEELFSRFSKTDGPISFIDGANKMMEFLKEAWDEAQRQRGPDIEEVAYTITDSSSFYSSIDDFRARLLKGTEKKEIKGCYLLPYQTEVRGVPYKWFHLLLIGRNDESTTLHTKHHNLYNMAFSNKEGKLYEMGPGGQVKQGEIARPFHPTIPGAEYAGFNCDYISMVNPRKLPWSNRKLMNKIKQVKVGLEPWQNSIHVFSYYGCDPTHHKTCPLCKPRYALQIAAFCISVMLNECTRMDGLKDPVGNALQGLNLTEILMAYIWHWRKMSHFLRRWDANRQVTVFFMTILDVKHSYSLKHPYSLDAVAAIMYLILNVISAGEESGEESDSDDQGPSSQLPPSGGDDADKEEMGKEQTGPPSPSEPGRDGDTKEQPQPPIGPGHNLLQIFSVTLEGINLADMGAILVHEERGNHVMYSSDGEESSKKNGIELSGDGEESLKKNEIELSGPSIAISSEAGCILELIPKTRNALGASEDTVVNLDDGFSYNDQHRLKSLAYGNGNLLISYAILTGAIEANLKIELLLPSRMWVTYHVSGILTATQHTGTSTHWVMPTEYLSSSSRGGPLEGMRGLPSYSYRPMKPPLSPSVLAVKYGESITVQGNLLIGKYSLNITEVLEVPRNIGLINTVRTPWTEMPWKAVTTPWTCGDGSSYRISMTLISRNI